MPRPSEAVSELAPEDAEGTEDGGGRRGRREPDQGWFFPRLVGWEGYPPGYRDKLMNASFGSATIKIMDGAFNDALANSMPAGIPFDPDA